MWPPRHGERARQRFEGKPKIYTDYCKMLERGDIDVIVNVTPDRWHTAINVAACRSGKDVYTEKPLTLTVDEGKILAKVVDGHSHATVDGGFWGASGAPSFRSE